METTRNDPGKTLSVRRVGSFTLGVCLIGAGVFFLLYYFVPGFNWLLFLKIAPAAGLILLGCEVLYFAGKPERWKYDFLSVFICLVLMICCFCLVSIPVGIEQYERYETGFQRDPEIERELNNAESRELDEENEPEYPASSAVSGSRK